MLDKYYSYVSGDDQVIDEDTGDYTSSNDIAFGASDTLTFYDMSAADVTSVGGAAVADGAGNVTLGVEGNTITLLSFTSELDASKVKFDDGSVLKTNNGATATLQGTNLSNVGDYLIAGNNGDTLYGYAGNDKLTGGSGADAIYGGAGADTIWGKAGNDYLSGGAGSDSYRFTANNAADDGNDVIAGFTVGSGASHDVIYFSDVINTDITYGTATDFVTDLITNHHYLVQSGADTLFISPAGDGETIRLLGVNMNNLVDANFQGGL